VRSSHRAGIRQNSRAVLWKRSRANGITEIVLTVIRTMRARSGHMKSRLQNVGSLVQDIGSGFVMDDYAMEKTVYTYGVSISRTSGSLESDLGMKSCLTFTQHFDRLFHFSRITSPRRIAGYRCRIFPHNPDLLPADLR